MSPLAVAGGPSFVYSPHSARTVPDQNEVFRMFRQLEQKIELLRSMHTVAQDRIKTLEKRNKSLSDNLEIQKNLVRALEEKQGNAEKNVPKSKHFGNIVSDNLSEADTSAALKQQLDEYIRDIERCIAHLSSLS